MKIKKYESEITQFMRDLMQKNPDMAADQQKARAMWWEKAPVTPKEQNELDASDLPKPAYAYFGDVKK
jgi:Protein of unknown function (DUF3460)